MPRLLFLTIAFFISLAVFGQEESEEIKKNRIAPLMGFVFIPEQINEEGDHLVQIIPTIGLDYERHLVGKWSIGLYNDLELNSYQIKDPRNNTETLTREFVFVSTLCVIYSPIEQWTVYTGIGYEFETHENFEVFRVGTEYEIPIKNDWDCAFGLSWDHKEIYNSIGYTVAFGKRF